MKFQKIREARKAANITQEELAQILGVNRATVSKYETGGIDVPTSQLKAIADALGILMVDLLDEDTSKIYNAGFIDGAVAEDMERQITFNATPDPEWLNLYQKLEAGTMTSAELQRWKDLDNQASVNTQKALASMMERLSKYIDILNPKGQQVAIERIEELTKIPDYQKDKTPPQPE